MEYYLITFSNTHAAIAAQKHLKDKLTFQVVPTLREISKSCGISLKISSAPYEEIMKQMNQFQISKDMYKIYYVTADDIIEIKL